MQVLFSSIVPNLSVEELGQDAAIKSDDPGVLAVE